MATDKLRKASSSSTTVATVTAVGTIRAVGETILIVKTGGLTGWSTDTSTDFTTYKLDGDGAIISKTDWTGRANPDTNTITELVVTNGTDTGNAVDDIVVCIETSAWVNDLIATLLNIFTVSGAIKTNWIDASMIINGVISTAKLATSAVTPEKMSTAARQQVLGADGTSELMLCTSATQPAAQPGKTIIWFKPEA